MTTREITEMHRRKIQRMMNQYEADLARERAEMAEMAEQEDRGVYVLVIIIGIWLLSMLLYWQY